jgi:hypothetical protein
MAASLLHEIKQAICFLCACFAQNYYHISLLNDNSSFTFKTLKLIESFHSRRVKVGICDPICFINFFFQKAHSSPHAITCYLLAGGWGQCVAVLLAGGHTLHIVAAIIMFKLLWLRVIAQVVCCK